jgi:hypothetical protein
MKIHYREPEGTHRVDIDQIGGSISNVPCFRIVGKGNDGAARLDVTLEEETVFPVCEPLTQRHVPFAFVSATVEPLPEKFA